MSLTFYNGVRCITGDPAASYWLKGAVEAALNCDPVDMLRDAEELVALLRLRENTLAQKELRQRIAGWDDEEMEREPLSNG